MQCLEKGKDHTLRKATVTWFWKADCSFDPRGKSTLGFQLKHRVHGELM